ncbi:hypothetical protein EV424DRAFT_1350002 [Suillus variegatus]|nr:hypothetical protein EV424DRAFT_1350002 [Suillus variegatus]
MNHSLRTVTVELSRRSCHPRLLALSYLRVTCGPVTKLEEDLSCLFVTIGLLYSSELAEEILNSLCSLRHQASFAQSTLSRGSRRLRSERPRATVNNVEIAAWQNSPDLPNCRVQNGDSLLAQHMKMSLEMRPRRMKEWRKPPRTAHEDVSRAAPSQDERLFF